MAKVNKERTSDVFSGLKYVDKLMNEAAGVGNPPKKLSFEDKMKQKLKEGYNEASEEIKETENLDEYEYNHPYTNNAEGSGSTYLGEDEPEFGGEDFGGEFDDDEFGYEDETEFGDHLGDSQARRAATRDIESEFAPEEDEFDFTEDENLLESLLEAEPALDIPDDQTTDDSMPPVAAGEEPAPIDATATDEMGIEGDAGIDAPGGIEGMDDLGSEDPTMGGEPEMGGMGSAPSMGGGMPGAEPTGMDAAAPMSPVDGPEDIDQLIADLVAGTGAEEQPAVFGENAHKDLGFKDLGDDDVNSNKVKMEAKESKAEKAKEEKEEAKDKKAEKKEVKEGEIKLTKLGDADITGNVKGALSTGKVAKHSGTGKRNDPKGEEYTDLGDEDVTANKVGKSAEKAAAPAQPKFSSLKKENEEKTKALFTLAEQVITLQDEVTNLKFAKFKLEKVNSVLTLLPELKLATREKLVEKFDSCKSYAETKKLYAEVAEMVKDHKRGSLNEAVAKTQKSGIKYFAEDASDDSSRIDEETARRNMLMGLPGFDESYGAY